MTSAAPQIWDIYHLLNFQQMDPPKDKFIAVTLVTATYFCGFVVSKRYPAFVQGNGSLHPCYAQMLKSEHSFLNVDSLVDCIKQHMVTPADQIGMHQVGRVSRSTAMAMKIAVNACPRQTPKVQKYVSDLVLPS